MNPGVTYLNWKRSSGWLESWQGLLFVTDISTNCAETIFRVTVLVSWKFKTSGKRYAFTNGYSTYWPIKILLAKVFITFNYWLRLSLDSEDGFRTDCWNVKQRSFSGLQSPRWSFSIKAVMHAETFLFSLNENTLRQFWLNYNTILPFEFSKNIVKGRNEHSINPSSKRLWKW